MVDGAAGDRIALTDGPFHRGDTAMARQQRGVVADPARVLPPPAAPLLMRAWLCAVTIQVGAARESPPATTNCRGGLNHDLDAGGAGGRGKRGRRRLATTTRMMSTPCCRSVFRVVTPKGREPTRVIRLVVVPWRLMRGIRPVDNTPERSFTPSPRGVGGYQQGPRHSGALACAPARRRGAHEARPACWPEILPGARVVPLRGY